MLTIGDSSLSSDFYGLNKGSYKKFSYSLFCFTQANILWISLFLTEPFCSLKGANAYWVAPSGEGVAQAMKKWPFSHE